VRATLPPEAIGALRERGIAPADDHAKYDPAPVATRLEAIWDGRAFVEQVAAGHDAPVALLLAETNHYAESGGQVADHGRIRTSDGATFVVEDVQVVGVDVLHWGRLDGGTLAVGAHVEVAIDTERRAPTMANHTATHLLNHALRNVIGEDVDQRGSLVAPDRLRFDFTCSRQMKQDEITEVEALVGRAITAAMPVYADVAPLAEARRITGLRAVFGERYPDPVRVVSIGCPVDTLIAQPDNPEWRRYTVEFCGGTHLERTDEAGPFVIMQEQALAAGIRRIGAVTGDAAQTVRTIERSVEHDLETADRLDGAALVAAMDALQSRLDHETLGLAFRHRIEPWLGALRDRVKTMRKAAHGAARDNVVGQAREIAERVKGSVIVEAMAGADKETLLSAMDVIRSKHPDAATLLLSPDEDAGKVMIAATVPASLIERGLKAGDWVREVARICGGGGGGRPDMAQAGGKDPAKVPEAAAAARSFAESALE
jgi:alanyl-tRNA synthetase